MILVAGKITKAVRNDMIHLRSKIRRKAICAVLAVAGIGPVATTAVLSEPGGAWQGPVLSNPEGVRTSGPDLEQPPGIPVVLPANPKMRLDEIVSANGSGTVSAAIVSDLVRWIGRNTSYDISKTLANPPDAQLAPQGMRIAYEGRYIDLGPPLRAVYDAYARSIYLKRPWDAGNVHDLSTLLHELVHDVQYRNRHWPCPRKAEWEAYRLQTAWLAERGEVMGFNWLAGTLMSGCRGDVHP